MRMKKILICGLLTGMVSGICGCSGQAAKEEAASGAAGEAAEISSGQGTETVTNDSTDWENAEENEEESAEDFVPEAENSAVEPGIDVVGIEAHVKEIHGDTLLISSDSDDFPGAFAVTGADEMPEFSDLQGGTAIQIVMGKSDGTDEQGLAKYRAEKIVIISGDEEEAHADVLLLEAPVLTLQDALSSKMDKAELAPGNYNWNVENGEEGTGVVACGVAPLEEAAMDFTVKVKVPEYNGMSGVPYMLSVPAAPDNMVVRQWNAGDIGNMEAKEERVTKYYFNTTVLDLEAGKVYEFALEWKKGDAEANTFYGSASYVLVTE